jgi:hypothetical protein
MAFVRKKKVYGHEYYQLVESYREDGRMRQRVLAHLGHAETLEAAREDATTEIEKTRDKQQALRKEREGILAELNEQLPEVMRFHGGTPPRYGEFHSANLYGRITYNASQRYRGGFPHYRSRYGRRPRSANYGDPVPYYGYWGFVGVCGRYWRIPDEIEKLGTRAERLEKKLEKLGPRASSRIQQGASLYKLWMDVIKRPFSPPSG